MLIAAPGLVVDLIICRNVSSTVRKELSRLGGSRWYHTRGSLSFSRACTPRERAGRPVSAAKTSKDLPSLPLAMRGTDREGAIERQKERADGTAVREMKGARGLHIICFSLRRISILSEISGSRPSSGAPFWIFHPCPPHFPLSSSLFLFLDKGTKLVSDEIQFAAKRRLADWRARVRLAGYSM